MAVDAKDRILRASKAVFHKDLQFNEGQWVYVWRRVGSLDGAPTKLARSRWVGPGLVTAQRRNTVYVAMRA
eukprot:14238744-Alexandrium_andersonii.AAC.1